MAPRSIPQAHKKSKQTVQFMHDEFDLVVDFVETGLRNLTSAAFLLSLKRSAPKRSTPLPLLLCWQPLWRKRVGDDSRL